MTAIGASIQPSQVDPFATLPIFRATVRLNLLRAVRPIHWKIKVRQVSLLSVNEMATDRA
jgi:hypothetical protein